jgi:hypothetical protein
MSNEQLQKEIEMLKQEIQNLKSSTTIPYDVDQAFRVRLSDLLALSVSSKGVNTEDVTVNEAGVASYAVMNDPDGFLQVTLNGTVYYLPYFS